jgi:hypothetical protein
MLVHLLDGSARERQRAHQHSHEQAIACRFHKPIGLLLRLLTRQIL